MHFRILFQLVTLGIIEVLLDSKTVVEYILESIDQLYSIYLLIHILQAHLPHQLGVYGDDVGDVFL